MTSFFLRNEPVELLCPCLPMDASNETTKTSLIQRFLEEDEEDQSNGSTFEMIYTCIVLCGMFGALVSDKLGADSILLTTVTAFMAAEVITIKEGLDGFANEGLLTVLVLFVVAEGISKTGALDWYMSKLLGRPSNVASAQLRLMIPIAVVSGFLNNTPVVIVMIPIVQRWAKNCRLSAQQLLIPLSFASILGGTCTLIGTSTNLVVVGLLDQRYPNDSNINIGLFSLGAYGVPVAMAGIAYVLLFSPFLLAGREGASSKKNDNILDSDMEDILLGARLTQWSPAAGRTVKRSGLRDTGGIFLVSVHRATTGNVHRAVSQDFVLNAGDTLYFTGLVEEFGEFCEEHGLEVVTNEVEERTQHYELVELTNNGTFAKTDAPTAPTTDLDHLPTLTAEESAIKNVIENVNNDIPHVVHDRNHVLPAVDEDHEDLPIEIGVTKESLLFANEDERLRHINRMTDMIRGVEATEDTLKARTIHHARAKTPTIDVVDYLRSSTTEELVIANLEKVKNDTPRLVNAKDHMSHVVDEDNKYVPIEVGATKESLLFSNEDERSRHINQIIDIIRGVKATEDTRKSDANTIHHTRAKTRSDPTKVVVTIDRDLVVVAVDTNERPALLLDISKGLHRLNLQLHHIEAAVVNERSLSIWWCEDDSTELPDLEEIWTVISSLLSNEGGVQAIKQRGLQVIRGRVIKGSRLIGRTATEVKFRTSYKAAIVAIQNGRKMGAAYSLSTARLEEGDILIMQANDDSPLLMKPPEDFYKSSTESFKHTHHRSNSGMARPSYVGSVMNRLRHRSEPSLSVGDYSNSSQSGGGGVRNHSQRSSVGSGRNMNDNGLDGGHFLSNAVEDAVVNNSEGQVADLDLSGGAFHGSRAAEDAWKDIQVTFRDEENGDGSKNKGGGGNMGGTREFLTAMAVAPNSYLAGKTVAQLEIDKLPELFLVGIDRPGTREFLTAMAVVPNSNLAGKKVAQVDLNKFPELFLVSIEGPVPIEQDERHHLTTHTTRSMIPEALSADRNGSIIGSVTQSVKTEKHIFEAVDLDDSLEEGDILWFSGPAAAVGDLRKIPGLVSCENEEVEKINEKVHDRRLVQAVIARKGPLVGKTVKEVRFRTRYGAAVIAVHREGQRIHEHPGKIRLQGGDVLLLEAGPTFIAKSSDNDRSFALLAEVENSAPPRLSMLVPALLLAAGMLIVSMAGLTSLLVSALVASILMVAFGILSEQEARDAINWEAYITIAGAFGTGTALVNSGIADAVANFFVDVGTAVGMGDAGLLGAVYFATSLISNIVTNNAAAALLFPIAMNAAEQTGTDRTIMAFILMLGASASFMSPFGYTTNLLIYGPGGYKYNDFLLFGTPMQIILWVLSTAYLSFSGAWYVSWLVTGAVLACVIIFRVYLSSVKGLFSRESNFVETKQKDKYSAKRKNIKIPILPYRQT